MSVAKLNLSIIQGATFDKTINWYGGGKVCKAIEGVTSGCPTLITITGHGLPTVSDTPVFIDHVKGAKSLNTKGKATAATYVDADSFYVDKDTYEETWEVGTGHVTWYAPRDLTGYTARMQIRPSVASETIILSLTSPDDIIITTNDAGIQIVIAASVTETLDFDSAVYDLELENPALSPPYVHRLVEGEVTLLKEVTR